VRVAAEGENRRMLQQEERVADEILLARRDDALLDGERFGIRNASEMEEIDVHLSII